MAAISIGAAGIGLVLNFYICVMVKYRRLTKEELDQLEDSFIRFLAAQSISGEDWVKIMENDPQRQKELIDQFSDVVIEKTLHNVKILEHRTAKRILFFEFFDKKALLYGIEWDDDPPFSLVDGFALKELANLLNNPENKHHLLSGEKEYAKEKNLEIFEVMEKGAQIPANNDLFNFVLKIFDKTE